MYSNYLKANDIDIAVNLNMLISTTILNPEKKILFKTEQGGTACKFNQLATP